MTPQNIITSARYILNDTDSTSPRQTDAELLGYVNDGLKAVAILRPALFSTIGDYACVPGQCEQTLNFDSAVSVLDVISIHSGAAVVPFDIKSMNTFNPNWRNDTAGAATQWAKFESDPLRFFIYPQAPASQILDVVYVKLPTVYTLTQGIEDLPDVYQPALVDFVVYRAESKDNEHVLSQRATSHQAAFVAQIKG
jgi:hypothetical protein